MSVIPNQDDRGVRADPDDRELDRDGDGFIDGPLGDPAAPEDAGSD